MGLRPARANENGLSSPRRRGPIGTRGTMDSRFRGNDELWVIFGVTAGDEESRLALKCAVIPSAARNLARA